MSEVKVSVSGFPRVGKDRELKFAEEKYFRGEISEDILQKVARELRLSHWQEQKKAGIDLIPSNDFSFYDQLLDTAVLFNIIPERYKTLDLSDLERYFAMARGYQGSKGDVKALAMKKWFNTNYHYMVPEIDDDTFIELKNPSEAKPLQEYREAKAQGIETKPVVIGPFTLLKLLKYKGSKSAFDYKCILAKEYFKLITAFENAGVQWLQLDEPYLVRDLSPEDIELFEIIYKKILPARTQLKVLLNTYFGDVRDIYPKLLELNFDGIGLDFLVHGEFERNDMVEYFGDHLKGYVFTEKAWVQSYGSRCVKPPIIWGDVSRSKAITVEWSKFAQSLTDKPVKGMLTGPVTILNWSFPREDISLKESTQQIALAIRDEVLDLEAAGIMIIQIDEAALREKLPLRKSDWYSQYLDWAIPAFRLVHSGVQADTQIHTHMCYSEFTDIIPAIDAMDADVITFEASRSDLLILDSLAENHFRTEVGPGVYDIHSPRVPSVEEITKALGKMLEKVEAKKLWVNPDCGLKTRGVPETLASLKNLVAAAKEIRQANS